ncbi:hypothetical protein [Prochlorococcus marinus]|uniref:hypothetical protein n=1 Tax=Prochlorococcus marinus TaxID=1219 RepID=UPI001C59961B|nr:hypothetical protein [Prochlorococcus marinus]MBW3042192.1 hypothetical protein [Prochlorococcus marinus str. XMU1408]
MDPIQVLGKKDVRSEVQVNVENTAGQLLVKNTFAGNAFEGTARDTEKPKRYVRGMSKMAKQHFINRKDCPVKNHFIGLAKWTREDSVKAFDTYLWSQHQKDAIEKPAKDWFNARVKELMAGHNIDLIDDIDFVKGNDDSHGYTLKNYIEYLAQEI